MTEQEYNDRICMEHLMQRNGCGQPILACILFVVLMLCSCGTKTKIEYVDREVEKLVVKEVHDTLREQVHDSVFQTIYQRGDTVFSEKYVEKTKWRDRVVERKDTCWRDSVRTEYKEKVSEVVKYPKSYWYLLGISILFFIFAFVKLIRWLQII